MSHISRFGKIDGPGASYRSEGLLYLDSANSIIGPLLSEPFDVTHVELFAFHGTLQEYSKDYTVRQVLGTSPGWYVCISTSSTAPSGSWFIGGSNPGAGIDSVLELNDKVKVQYFAKE